MFSYSFLLLRGSVNPFFCSTVTSSPRPPTFPGLAAALKSLLHYATYLATPEFTYRHFYFHRLLLVLQRLPRRKPDLLFCNQFKNDLFFIIIILLSRWTAKCWPQQWNMLTLTGPKSVDKLIYYINKLSLYSALYSAKIVLLNIVFWGWPIL